MIIIVPNYKQQNVQHTEGLLGKMWVINPYCSYYTAIKYFIEILSRKEKYSCCVMECKADSKTV